MRSRITPEIRARVEAVPGVAAVGGIGGAQLGASVPGNDPRDLVAVALFGYELPPEGVPEPPAAGEVYADRSLEAGGVEKGMTIQVGPPRTPVKVDRLRRRARLLGAGHAVGRSPGRGVTWSTKPARRRGRRRCVPGPGGAGRAGHRSGDAGPAIDRDDRRRHPYADPRRGGQRHPRRRAAIEHLQPDHRGDRRHRHHRGGAVLRAADRRAHRAVRGAQGASGRAPARCSPAWCSRRWWSRSWRRRSARSSPWRSTWPSPPGGIPFTLLPARVLSSVVFLLVAAIIGCAFSLRRVLRIDPASAIGSGS